MDYDSNHFDEIELYDLSTDISEKNNVAGENIEVVTKIKIIADEMRKELGDKLYDQVGVGNREIGTVDYF